jgi:hypothetical protein
MPGHQFWPDDLSLTDLYLLGLAVKHGGRFATFHSRIDPSLVPGGLTGYHLIPSVIS